MLTESFDYYLPDHLIAKEPLPIRSGSKMLVLNRKDTSAVEHAHTSDIASFLKPGDLVIANNTKVMKARLYGRKETGGKLEFLIDRLITDRKFLSHIKSSRSPKEGSIVFIDTEEIRILARDENLFVCESAVPVSSLLDRYGCMPIPPYFQRDSNQMDDERYQTTFAQHDGSVAAPTAGLHIDDMIRHSFSEVGIAWEELTLHVGSGTFQPIKTESIEDHVIHEEYMEVSQELVDKINSVKAKGGRVVGVGTTSVRALETAFDASSGKIKSYKGMTNKYITPGYAFNVIDAMMTNFHLPKSSLLMLVSAFYGHEETMKAYKIAIENQYRFYSYGDAMLIL